MTGHDPDDDRELQALLRSATPLPPADAVDWSALHARIATRAQPLLRGEGVTAWWQLLAGWARRGIPLTATAAAAALLLLVTGVVEPRVASTQDVAFRSIEEELASELADDAPLLLSDASTDQVLDALLFYDEEGT